MRELKNRLKKCQPYYIEKELLPNLFFCEEREEQEKWIFIYSFIRRLTDTSIGIRLGYTSSNIHYITKNILEANEDLINEFLSTHNI